MKCPHTGLPRVMCGHCNGSNATVAEPFTGRREQDEEPRFRKGRDSAEWVGYGQSVGQAGVSVRLQDAAQVGMRRGFTSPWSEENARKLLAGRVAPIAVVAAALSQAMPVVSVVDGRVWDCDTKVSPPRKTSSAVPRVANYEKMPHARSRKQTAARIVARNRS